MIDFETLSRSSLVYPKRLLTLFGGLAAPNLYFKGNLSLLEGPTVGFCGSRKASEAGIKIAQDCAQQLSAEGICVVSGYATGVDIAAHRAALAGGATTIVVL